MAWEVVLRTNGRNERERVQKTGRQRFFVPKIASYLPKTHAVSEIFGLKRYRLSGLWLMQNYFTSNA